MQWEMAVVIVCNLCLPTLYEETSEPTRLVLVPLANLHAPFGAGRQEGD